MSLCKISTQGLIDTNHDYVWETSSKIPSWIQMLASTFGVEVENYVIGLYYGISVTVTNGRDFCFRDLFDLFSLQHHSVINDNTYRPPNGVPGFCFECLSSMLRPSFMCKLICLKLPSFPCNDEHLARDHRHKVESESYIHLRKAEN